MHNGKQKRMKTNKVITHAETQKPLAVKILPNREKPRDFYFL
jgi:hypothetical protein